MTITIDDINLSVISALIGLAVTIPFTYLIVDRVVERIERKKLIPVEKLAKERLRSKLGVGFLTTFLITLVIDITTAVKEKHAIPKDTLSIHIEKLKTAQSDLEMLLGVYNNVLDVEITRLTSDIILDIEHLQEDFEFLAEIHPKGPSHTHAAHIEKVILHTVRITKQELERLGADNLQIRALEDWLTAFTKNQPEAQRVEEPIEVMGGHLIT